jgi:hypothetical protein
MWQAIAHKYGLYIAAVWVGLIVVLAGCTSKLYTPDLAGLYNELIQTEDPYRNAVIVIPGILATTRSGLNK